MPKSKRSLSKRESELILSLEWERKNFIDLKGIEKRLRCSPGYARKLAHILIKKGWLEPLTRGKYLLISASRGPKGIPDMNPYLVARSLKQPYFFAYRLACFQHGLLSQVPTLIHIAVRKQKQPIEIKNVRFKFIILSKKRFFGSEEMSAFGEKLKISDLERTVLDALDRPELVGGIETAAQVLLQAGKKIVSAKILNYLQRMNDSALARRFGYLAELLGIKLSKKLEAFLKSQVKKDPAYLGKPKRWGSAGQHNKRWNLILNVPKRDLMGEIRII